jgi:hypothetical protein
MKGKKLIGKKEEIENNISYEIAKYEIKEIDIKKDDFNFLYENVCEEDYELAFSNGLYTDENGDYAYLDCSKMLESMNYWKEEKMAQDEWDYNDDFIETFDRIYRILEENQGFDIWYS